MWCHFYVNTFCCAAPLLCGNLSGTTAHWKKKMAVRKKSETIHLRVKPISKALLEGLANSTGKTSTQVIEDLITAAAEKFIITDVEALIDEDTLEDGQLSLKSALESAHYPDEPILTKLRTYYIAGDALSVRDSIIAATIIQTPKFFSGNTQIFSISDGFINRDHLSDIPKIDLDEISKRMSSLEDFAAFREKNPNWTSSYAGFLKMTGED